MSLASKSPQDVAREALAAGNAALTPYSVNVGPPLAIFATPCLVALLHGNVRLVGMDQFDCHTRAAINLLAKIISIDSGRDIFGGRYKSLAPTDSISSRVFDLL